MRRGRGDEVLDHTLEHLTAMRPVVLLTHELFRVIAAAVLGAGHSALSLKMTQAS